MNISTQEKRNYIKNYFHQYLDISLSSVSTLDSENVNVIIPFNELYKSGSAYQILSEYPNTDISKEQEVYCTKVIDGDTIWVKDVEYRNETTNEVVLSDKEYKVRFVGIDTPEIGEEGANKATKFVKQCCFKKFIHLNIDNKKTHDKYGRVLAVVIVKNKNLNEVLLGEKLAKIEYIPPSEFNPQEWSYKDHWRGSIRFDSNNTDDLSKFSSFLNNNGTNVIFTPRDDYDTIYQYEEYKDVYYIKANPYSKTIRMHILPRNYDCSDTVLFLRDDMTDKLKIIRTGDYKVYSDRGINAYFQEGGEDRLRTADNINALKSYNMYQWGEDESSTFVEFNYDVSEDTKSFNNIEICVGYKYNNCSPYYAIHYTGVKDNTNLKKDDQATLLDVNVDLINTHSNSISQMAFKSAETIEGEEDEVYIKHDVKNNIKKNVGKIDHTTDVNRVHYKKIKYINDSLYIEEDNTINGFCNWIEPTI